MQHDSPSSLVATFPDRDSAHRALRSLHEDGFHDTWIGLLKAPETDSVTHGSEAVVESDNAVARFFVGQEPLSVALSNHGVSDADAARIDGSLPVGSAIVTVHGSNHPELAAQTITASGGRIVSSAGASRLSATYGGAEGAFSADRLQTLGNYNEGAEVDEARRLRLREERLTIGKQREATGEATVGTKVVSENVSLDVPTFHEELYVERRPASGAYGDVGTIGDGTSIRVPLERETAVVGKETVVTGEVLVGQRRVEEVQHVSETVRKEEPDVNTTRVTETKTAT